MLIDDEVIKRLSELDLHLYNDVNNWAVKCLEKGFDSPSLRILASMQGNYSPSEYDVYLKRSLNELGWDKIARKEYLLRYAKIVAKQIIDEEREPFGAAREIYQILLDLEYPSELYDWIEIDEMIWDYNYYLETGNKGYYFREKEKLIEEIKKMAKETIDK